MRDIEEENARILENSTGRRNQPFDWGEVGNQLAALAKDEYNRSRERREEHIAEWENRNRSVRKSNPDLFRTSEEEPFFSFGDSLSKDKSTGNPALVLLREDKRKKLEKEAKRKNMEKEKDRLYAIAKEERRIMREDMYPPPPYKEYAHYIPDSMYEELQLKRLMHGLYTTSDPEDTRRKPRAYPMLPEDDYAYVQTQHLRHWINEGAPKASKVENNTDGSTNNVRNRPRLPIPVRPPPSTSSDDDEPLKTYSIQKRPMRLKGGGLSGSDMELDFDTDGEMPPNSRLTASGKLVRKKAEKTPDKTEKEKTEDENMRKKMKESEKLQPNTLSARNNDSPGIRESTAKEFRIMAVKLGAKMSETIATESAKKKISVSVTRDLLALNEAYQDLISELILENAVLLGRLWESRASEEAETMVKSMAHKAKPKTVRSPPREGIDYITVPGPSTEVVAPVPPLLSRNRRRKNVLKSKKQVRIADRPTRTDTDITSDAATDVEFVEVRKKKKKTRRRNQSGPSGTDTDTQTGRTDARKQKLEALKSQEPQRVFVVDVGPDVNTTRKTVWADIVKKNGAPKFARQTVTTDGEKKLLHIVAADDATYAALKSVTEERKDMQLKPTKWPMLMVYDVDATLSAGEVSCNILAQNTDIGNLLEGAALDKFKPMFKRGPREKDTVWWVCEVRPDIHAKLLKAGRVYVGMSNCRVSEYFDFQQCFQCLKYGHREVHCKESTMTCTHCGEKGHKDTVCTKIKDPPKCANCGGNHVAHSKFCRERRKAIDNAVRRTDYKDPTCQQ